ATQLRLRLLVLAWSVPSASSSLALDRKSTRLNSSHRCMSYAVFCLNVTATETSGGNYNFFGVRDSIERRQSNIQVRWNERRRQFLYLLVQRHILVLPSLQHPPLY